ncbi:MAG: PxKF domain-containing protein [Clostridiaceae bacterium]|nr:PxKF domain-containing protein [Clostridiaceae bacterium]
MKFSLKDFALANVSTATETISYARFNNNVLGSDVEAVSTSAARSTGSAFRYDSTAKQYIFNLSTKTLTAGTYKLTITLND